MKCLIIGIDNKIAVNYLNFLIRKVDDIYYCIDNVLPSELLIKDASNFIFIEKEINIENIEEVLLKNNIDKVINFFELNTLDCNLDEYIKYNYDFIVELYNSCVKYDVDHFVFTTTTDVYGNNNIHRKETDVLKHTSHYITSKINADLYLQTKNEINISIVRIAEVFGLVHRNSFLDILVQNVLNDEIINVEEDSDFIKSYIDVLDCVYFINQILIKELFGIYNICSNTYLSAKKIIETIEALAKYRSKVNFLATKSVELQFVMPESAKIVTSCKYTVENQEDKLKYYLKNIIHNKKLNLIK